MAVAALAGTLALVHRAPLPAVLVTSLAGEGKLHRDGQDSCRSRTGMALRAGDEVEALAAVSPGLARRAEPTTVRLAAGASVRLAALRAPERVELIGGALEAEVAPQPQDRPMVFACGDTEAEVLGTRLALVRDGARTRLSVIEGRVRLADAAGAVEVAGGAVAETIAAAAPELVPLPGSDGVVRVSTARMLARAVAEAESGRVIEIAGGVYALDAPLLLPAGVKDVVVRGTGPDARATRLDGGG